MDRLSACCHNTVSSTPMPGAPGPGGAGGGGQFAVILRTPGAFTLTTVYVEDKAKGTWVVAMHGASAVEACSVRLELKPTGVNLNLPLAPVVVRRKSPAPRMETVASMARPLAFRTVPRTAPYCPDGLRVSVIAGTCVVVPGWIRALVCVGVYRFAVVAI